MSCRPIRALLSPFNDGELSAEKVIEVEQHLSECQHCAEQLRLINAFRLSVRQVVRANVQPSAAFQARLTSAIEAAHQREWEARVLDREIDHNRMLSWRTIAPVAAAAALSLFLASNDGPKEPALTKAPGKYWNEGSVVETAKIDAILEDLVDHHLRTSPEITEPKLLSTLEKEVGVPVHVPSLVQYGARWEGGKVIPIRNQRAAFLRYKLGNDRVTVYVYDSSRVPIEHRLQQRHVGDETVYVGSRRGFSIGVRNHRGVGYAMASDLNDAETAELVAALDR